MRLISGTAHSTVLDLRLFWGKKRSKYFLSPLWRENKLRAKYLHCFPLLANSRGDNTSQDFWGLPSTPSPNISHTLCWYHPMSCLSPCEEGAVLYLPSNSTRTWEQQPSWGSICPHHTDSLPFSHAFLSLSPGWKLLFHPNTRKASHFHSTIKAPQEWRLLYSDKASKHQGFEQKLWVHHLRHQQGEEERGASTEVLYQ